MAGNEKKADISMTGNKSGKPSIDGKTLKRPGSKKKYRYVAASKIF